MTLRASAGADGTGPHRTGCQSSGARSGAADKMSTARTARRRELGQARADPERARPAAPPWSYRPAGPNQVNIVAPWPRRAEQSGPWVSLEVSRACVLRRRSPGTAASRGVIAPFRVSPPAVAAHWFAAPTAVLHLSTLTLAVFLPAASGVRLNTITPLMGFDSPSEAGITPGPIPLRSSKATAASWAPSSESHHPSAHQFEVRPLRPRLAPALAATVPRPLRSAYAVSTTLTSSSAPRRPRVSSVNALGLWSSRALPAPTSTTLFPA